MAAIKMDVVYVLDELGEDRCLIRCHCKDPVFVDDEIIRGSNPFSTFSALILFGDLNPLM